jgi:putative SOS response-associated peptidase YedK
MCADYRIRLGADRISQSFSETQIPLRFPEGIPNLEPRDDVRITDPGPIVRLGPGGEPELVVRRWSWPAPNGKPVYNFRSEGRQFGAGRCLIVTDGFYEFTPHTDPKSKRKHKWLFTLHSEPLLCIAGLWRSTPQVGEAFTMLTTDAGPDVAPYHSRQIIVLPRADWAQWLDPKSDVADLLRPLPAGSLEVAQIN